MNDIGILLNYLKTHITIEHKDSDTRLVQIIRNAIPDLQEKIGCETIDFSRPSAEQTFFLNYCKYCYFGQEHTFFETYQKEFLQLRDNYLVKEEKK